MQAYAINLSAVHNHPRRGSRALRRARTLRLLLLVLVALIVLVFAPRIVQTAARPAAPHTVTYVVSHGETLWEIASAHSQGEDVRKVIARIKRLNGLTSGTVHPGQRLSIPVVTHR